MISSRLAEGVLVLVVLASLAGAAFQPVLKPGEEGAMFVDPIVLEQPTVAAEVQGNEGEAQVTQSSVAAQR